jgi:hypothetical protein
MKILGFETDKAKRTSKNDPQGETTTGIESGQVRRKWNNLTERSLYRELRYNIPVIDRAIKALTLMNGTLKVYASNDRKQRFIDEFFLNVPVRNADSLGGIQNYGVNEYLSQISNMSLEQGFAIGEMIRDIRGKNINRIQVPDALSFTFRTEPGGKRTLWQSQFMGAKQIIPDDFIQSLAYDDRGGEYYSLLWNLEVTSDVLLRIWQSVEKDWVRFGDKSILALIGAEGSADIEDDDIKKAATGIIKGMKAIFAARQLGKAKDHYQQLPKGVKVEQQIVGEPSGGTAVKREFAETNRAFMEQLTVVTGLPGWMLNQNWSTTERLSSNQLKQILHEAAQRQTKLLPLARKAVRNWLDLQGKVAWLEGEDYWFEWDNVDIDDSKGQAETRETNETAEQVRLENIEFRVAQGWITPEEGKRESERRPYTN